MSVAKRSRHHQANAPLPRSPSQPATKRIKSSHVPESSGLDFLVDENSRPSKKVHAQLTNGAPRLRSSRVDESHVVVAPGDEYGSSSDSDSEDEETESEGGNREIIAISSGEEESSELEEDDEEEDADQPTSLLSGGKAQAQPLTNGHISDLPDAGDQQRLLTRAEGTSINEADVNDGEDAVEDEEPTFGDLLRARHPEPIDLQNATRSTDGVSRGLARTNRDQLIPTGHTLGTVLSQALKTNDKEMLEKCLALTDQNSIRATVQRQTSQEAAMLLAKIAERIHGGPGRTGILLTWIQWSLVCHGGYIAHQPELMKKVRSLAQVLRQRANGLQPLLHLKGKLDLLTAQLELRRSMQQASRDANSADLDDEQGVLYIEGEDEDESDSDEAAVEGRPSQNRKARNTAGLLKDNLGADIDEDEDEDEGAYPGLANGVLHDHDSSSDEEENEDELDGIVDDEAGEGSDDDGEGSSDEERSSQASSADEDVSSDEEEEEESDGDATIQVKPNKLSRKR